MVAEVIVAFGTPEQREQHVTRLCSGENVVGGFALSEAGAGSDPGGMTTRAVRNDAGWVLNGSKMWITSGTHSKLFVVWARTSDAKGAAGISCFLVDGDAPGVVRGKAEEKLGQHASSTTTLEFNDVQLSTDALLGEEGRGFRIAMMALDGGRIGIGSLAVGVAEAAHQFAVKYAIDRKQFGRSISKFQAIQWMIADSQVELDAARSLVLRAAFLKQQGKAFTREASIAKLYASERAFGICDRAIQILGGNGYSREYPVERHLRDVRVTRIYEGTSEIQRLVISRDIVSRYLKGP
jgi:alkylation response protein AidB-like acyl-CoA dehydrogenase